jgi:hypothetical protein
MPRRAGTTAHVAHFEDRFLDLLDFEAAFKTLWKKSPIRPALDEFVRLIRAGKPMKARKALSPLYTIQLTKDALMAKRPQDRIRACEVGLVFAGEKPVEKGQMGGGNGGMVPQLHVHWDMSKLSTQDLVKLRALVSKARPALPAHDQETHASRNGH